MKIKDINNELNKNFKATASSAVATDTADKIYIAINGVHVMAVEFVSAELIVKYLDKTSLQITRFPRTAEGLEKSALPYINNFLKTLPAAVSTPVVVAAIETPKTLVATLEAKAEAKVEQKKKEENTSTDKK